MHQTDRHSSLLGMLLSAVLVGTLAMSAADTATLAVGLGVLLLVSLTVATNAVTLAVATTGTAVPGADRLRRQWGRAPMPLLAPDLPGNPQPRAPGRVAPEVLLLSAR